MKLVLSKLRKTGKAEGTALLPISLRLKASKWSYLSRFLLSLVLMTGCEKQGAPQSGAPTIKPDFAGVQSDERAVYSVLLKHFEKEYNEGGLPRFIVSDLTQSPPNTCIPNEIFRSDNQVFILGWQQSINDLKVKAEITFRLSDLFKFPNSYTFIAGNEFNTFTDTSNKDGFSAFRKKYPDTRCVITFSRIGFDDNKLKAIVYSESWCGPLSGAGDYYALTRVGGFWKIDKRLNCWVS